MGVKPLEVSLAGRDLTRIGDLVPAEAEAILDLAAALKLDPQPLTPRASLGLLFALPSTRTRVSFAVAMTQLGGASVPLQPEELQLSRVEVAREDARGVLERLAA